MKRLVRRIRDLKPHVKVGFVTFVLIISGIAVLAVSLTALSRVDDHVDQLQDRVSPARQDLLEVQQGLSATTNKFVSLMAEPDRAKRVIAIEDIRKQLSVDEEAWRKFKSESLQLPGETDLWAQYEAQQAELARMEGPVGLLLITADDPSTMWTDPNFAHLRDVQTQSQQIAQKIDNDYYAPLSRQETASASSGASAGYRNVWLAFLAVMALSIPLAIVSYVSARRTEAERRDDLARRAEEARRSTLEARLNRAFEMAGSEDAAYKIVGQALVESIPDQPSELLVSDSSIAHFRQVLSTDVETHGPGCAVVAPADCPAAHRGDTLVFARSNDLDACPYLRERTGPPCAAVCQPVSIAGKSIGVVHTTFDEGLPPDDRVMVDLELIARRAGERIGMLRAFAETESQAKTDPLTGLLNRRSLENSTRRLVHDGAQYCVAYGDLDHFKQLNDTHGHDIGDRALRTFSRALRDSIRPNDLACRYGGEEFVLVLPECEVEEAVTVVERVRTALSDALVGGRLPPFTVSFGVSNSSQAENFERVVALADEALLRAKANGRDRVLVSGAGPAELGPAPRAALEPGSF